MTLPEAQQLGFILQFFSNNNIGVAGYDEDYDIWITNPDLLPDDLNKGNHFIFENLEDGPPHIYIHKANRTPKKYKAKGSYANLKLALLECIDFVNTIKIFDNANN
jgi:hypothetical protein